MTKSDTVDILVHRMIDVMEDTHIDANMDEVMSAVMTLALRTIKASIKLGADKEKLRYAVEILMMECVDVGQAN